MQINKEINNLPFDLPKNQSNVIKVIGIGGGGSNAINYMYSKGIKGVDFVVCNTDAQALENSPVENKIQLGIDLTEGLGAGANPAIGEEAANESFDDIKKMLETNTKMVFITAGMGGGTGTGAAPIISKFAKEMDILTVGIVTIPFQFEGKIRTEQANIGIEKLRKQVDALIVINNNKLRDIYGNLGFKEGFAKADEVLATASKGIAEVITHHYTQNIDLKDAKTVLSNSGNAIMGSAKSSGTKRAIESISSALDSPLLNDNNIEGANYILLNITSGSNEVMMDEISQITDYIQDEAGLSADIIWGTGRDEELGDHISITLIATGFEANKSIGGIQTEKKKEKVVHNLKEENATVVETNTHVPDHPIDPELKSTEAPQVEQIKMELDVPVVEKVEDYSQKNDFQQAESVNEAPKIVHNLYDDEEDKEVTTIESIENVHEASVSESPTLNFESPKEETKDKTLGSDQNQYSSFEPTFNDVPPISSVHSSEETILPSKPDNSAKTSTFADELDTEERIKRSQQRLSQLNNLTSKLNNPSNISDLENEPAYIRRQVRLDNVQHSSENNVSRFTLGDDGENNPEIRPNNSFLHDNVD